MVMLITIDAVAPLRWPALISEHRLEAHRCRFDAGRHERASIDHNRQARMVRDPFMGLKPQGLDFHWVFLLANNRRKRLGRGPVTNVAISSLSQQSCVRL